MVMKKFNPRYPGVSGEHSFRFDGSKNLEERPEQSILSGPIARLSI